MLMDRQVYLLAAGQGRRAGGPKAWLTHKGEPLLERQLGFLLTLFTPASITVSVQEPWLERCAVIHRGVRWVPVDPERAALASFQALLRQVPAARWSFLYHVDMPVWEERLFLELSDRAEEEPEADAFLPEFEGRGGHPLLLSPAAAEAAAALDPAEDRLDHWLRSIRVRRIPTSSRAAVENWNTLPRDA